MTRGLIGGIGLTHLKVYDQRPGPDGIMAGCAHVHALAEEAYYCIAGTGAIELHDLERGFRKIALKPGSYVQFPPNTLHRSVSTGGLEVLAVMGNGGLPERGDARIYFGPEVDADPEEYARLVALVSQGLEGALARRDDSARAYVGLLALWERDRAAYECELERFIGLHRSAMAARRREIGDTLTGGAEQWAAVDRARLEALPDLADPGAVLSGAAGAGGVAYGMCGVLRQLASVDVER